METKPKFTNSPANDFSTFAKRIQGKSKEEQEKIRTELRTARYSSAKFIALLTPDSLSKISILLNCLPIFNAASSFDTKTI